MSYESDDDSIVDPAQIRESIELGLAPVHVMCDDPDDGSFVVFVKHLPNQGDTIVSEDGAIFRVKAIVHRVTRTGESDLITLMPNIYAERIGHSDL